MRRAQGGGRNGVAAGNLCVYDQPALAVTYGRLTELQPAEEAIVRALGPVLPQARMLDIGIGGGRTTAYFKDRVLEYVGIDYSAAMVAVSRERFASDLGRIRILRHDARDLTAFAESPFDLVLFSYNGLDYLDLRDRDHTIAQIARILTAGGVFCYSSHNIGALKALLSFPSRTDTPHLTAWPRALVRWCLLRLLNGSLRAYVNVDEAVINDGALGFRLRTSYVSPRVEVRRLTEAGFGQIDLYGADGAMVPMAALKDTIPDLWVHYLCRKRA